VQGKSSRQRRRSCGVAERNKKFDGEVVAKTVAGQGTEFLFTLPLHQGVPSEEV
jgi:signal transduction histidine kinase